jgi:hypothetical protein
MHLSRLPLTVARSQQTWKQRDGTLVVWCPTAVTSPTGSVADGVAAWKPPGHVVKLTSLTVSAPWKPAAHGNPSWNLGIRSCLISNPQFAVCTIHAHVSASLPAPATSMATFHPFPRLPFKLRAWIWRLTVELRTIYLEGLLAWVPPPVPAALQVCREARNMNLYGKHTFPNSFPTLPRAAMPGSISTST